MLKVGQLVEVTDAEGRKLQRRVVAIDGDSVFVCRPETFEAATAEGREPVAVGFNKRWVSEIPSDAA